MNISSESFNIKYMEQAIIEANLAAEKLECPIGAVIVHDNKIIARAHNLRETTNQATSHAELLCIEKACATLNSWRLIDCDLYVTLEPCPMCAGAIIQSRIKNVYFGAYDYKAGAAGSVVNLFEKDLFNHNVSVFGGVMEKDCQQLLSSFFRMLRELKK